MSTTKSINQIAQAEGNTSANEAQRIRDHEAAVKRAWRSIAFADGEAACTEARVAEFCGLPVDYVREVCGRNGYGLR